IALRRAAAGWPRRATWPEWASLFESRLQPLLGKSEDWSMFAPVLDELAGLGAVAEATRLGAAVERARAVSALRESLEHLRFPEGRFERRGVNVLSVTAARGLRFPLVIVAGLDEGRFPGRLRQDPLLLDRERRRIGPGGRLPLKTERGEEEKLL